MKKKDPYYDPDEEANKQISYELNHALLKLIQKTTNQQTHEILNYLVSEFETMIKEYSIDLSKKTATCVWRKSWDGKTGNWCHNTECRKKKSLIYPGTDITYYMSCSVFWNGTQTDMWDSKKMHYVKCEPNTNFTKVVVNLPSKMLRFNETDLAMALAEGDLLDMSSDIEEVQLKSSLTPAEKEARKELRKKKKKTKTDTTC